MASTEPNTTETNNTYDTYDYSDTTDNYCGYSTFMLDFNKNSFHAIYSYFMPFYFLFGLLARCLCLIAFYHQAKSERAYLFQIFATISELVEVLTFVLFTTSRYLLSGFVGDGVTWYKRCYVCMFIEAHLTNQMQAASALCSLLIALCMTLDRIYALGLPIRYSKTQDRRRQQWVIFFMCVFLSCLLASPGLCLFYPEWIPDYGFYWFGLDESCSSWYDVLILPYTWGRMITAACLLIASITLAIIFAVRMKKRTKVKKMPNGQVDQASEEMRRAKMLFLLTIIQSSLDVLSTSGDFIYTFIDTWFGWLVRASGYNDSGCVLEIMGPYLDLAKAMANLSEFYIAIVIMPSFRRMVIKNVKQNFNIGSTTVTTVTVLNNGRTN